MASGTIRIMTASDLHFNAEGRGAGLGASPEEIAERCARLAQEVNPDIFLFGGDLAEQGEGDFERGLEALDQVNVPQKLFIAGNNDVEQPWVAQNLGNYRAILFDRLRPFGWHLLDESPFIHGGLALAGNIGWYDGSLWRVPRTHDPKYPGATRDIKRETEEWFKQQFGGWKGTSRDFYEACHARLAEHVSGLIATPNVGGIIVGTHFVPSPEMVRFRANTKFDYLNYYMGAQGHADHARRDKVIMGVTGHTHRSGTFLVGDKPVHNLSGPRQPRLFEVMRDDDGKFVPREVDIAHTVGERTSDDAVRVYFERAFGQDRVQEEKRQELPRDSRGKEIPESIISARLTDKMDNPVSCFDEALRAAFNAVAAVLKNAEATTEAKRQAVDDYINLWHNHPSTRKGGMQRRVVLLASANAKKIPEYQKFFGRYGVEVFLVPNIYDEEVENLWLSSQHNNATLVSVVYDASNLYRRDNSRPALDEDLERVHNRADILVVAKDKTGTINRQLYTATVPGYIDLSRRPQWKEDVFSWDDIFVVSDTGRSYHDMVLAGHKISARDQALAEYLRDRFYDRDRARHKAHTSRGARRTIDFSLSVEDFVLANPMLMNSEARRLGLVNLARNVCSAGVFWRAGITRLQRNYWWPGLNGGLPFVGKPDLVHEITYFLHDLCHHLFPDLVYCGEEGRNYNEIYIAYRMMSEALTMILADMLFVDTLSRTGVKYDYSKRLIYPLFKDLKTDFSDPATLMAELKKVLRANVELVLTGRDDRYRQMLGTVGSGVENLEKFKTGYNPFFVADYQWTHQNLAQMQDRKVVFQKWWQSVSGLRDVADLRLQTVGEFARSAERHAGSLIDRVFEEMFAAYVVPAFRESSDRGTRAESLKRGFMRYMMGQAMVFSDYDYVPHNDRYRDALMKRLSSPDTVFDLEGIERMRGFYEEYVESLGKQGWMHPDQVVNNREVYQVFGDPVYVTYKGNERPNLADLAREIMGERIVG